MIDELSIVMPCEEDRIPLLMYTLGTYIKILPDYPVEFILVSRTIKEFNVPGFNVKIINYEYEGDYFNPSMALNLGVKNSSYKNVMITCPEVYPITHIFNQLANQIRGNYVCQAFDQEESGSKGISLVNTSFRGDNPGMYFMAIFKKEDIETINGWDEDFMGGYAFEDDDFGLRFVRAGLKFTVKDGMHCEHQYHPRCNVKSEGWSRNKILLKDNNDKKLIRPKNGLEKLEDETRQEE